MYYVEYLFSTVSAFKLLNYITSFFNLYILVTIYFMSLIRKKIAKILAIFLIFNTHFFYIFSVKALIATTTVDKDITTAPIAGLKTNPTPARTPAARGMAMIL